MATNKTYKLITTTQNIIKNKQNLEQLASLSSEVLQYIDAYYWNDIKIDYEKNAYLYEGLKSFEKLNNNRESIRYSGDKKEKDERESNSRWKT